MGRDFYYKFYNENKEEIKYKCCYLYCNCCDPCVFSSIHEIIGKYLEKKYTDCHFGLYTLEELNDAVNEDGKSFTPFEMLSYQFGNINNDLLTEIKQISILLKIAENYNENRDCKEKEEEEEKAFDEIVYVSFAYY